jgi:hypothetical protein
MSSDSKRIVCEKSNDFTAIMIGDENQPPIFVIVSVFDSLIKCTGLRGTARDLSF